MYKILFFSFFILTSTTSTAYAYMDPGTGSMLLQGLIGTIAAGLTYLSLYYSKIKEKLSKLIGKPKNLDKTLPKEEDKK